MRWTFALLTILAIPVAASADPTMELLQDNYLGGNATLPAAAYDGVAALSSERDTFVLDSYTGDDMVVPASLEYKVQRINWIGLVIDHPAAEYVAADVVIYPANPDDTHPIAPGTAPVAEFTDLAMTLTPTGESLLGLSVVEGEVDIPEVTLPEGRYYYAVRAVGNNRGRHYVATTGDGSDFGAGEQGIFQSVNFYNNEWTYAENLLEMPDPNNPGEEIAYPSDFAYQVWGTVVPEPSSVLLLLLGGLAFGIRR